MVMRHRDLAFYRPSAVVVARTILDIPLIFVLTFLFSVVIYFLAQLSRTGGQFWIFFLFVYLSAYAMTQLYRMFAAWLATFDDALRFSGLAILIMFFYTGYIVSKIALINNSPWFGWLYCTAPFLKRISMKILIPWHMPLKRSWQMSSKDRTFLARQVNWYHLGLDTQIPHSNPAPS